VLRRRKQCASEILRRLGLDCSWRARNVLHVGEFIEDTKAVITGVSSHDIEHRS
jgi:hypothetical protein